MTVADLLRTIYRWQRLILAVVLITLFGVGIWIGSIKPVYEAQVKLLLTAPEVQDVVLFDTYHARSRDNEILIARNNFADILQSPEIRSRTVAQLHLSGQDSEYSVEINTLRDTDYSAVVVRARTPQLAEQIANTQVALAIAYYGEVRSKPATVARAFLNTQLDQARVALRSAVRAFRDFKTHNQISAIDHDLASKRATIEHLQLERDEQSLHGSADPAIKQAEVLLSQLELARANAYAHGETQSVQRFDATIASYTARLADLRQAASAGTQIDDLIAMRQAELAGLVALVPTYNELQAGSERASQEYQLLLDKYNEAVLKESTLISASSIQIFEPAVAPAARASNKQKAIVILALIGSAGVGLFLAFLFEWANRYRASGRVALNLPQWYLLLRAKRAAPRKL